MFDGVLNHRAHLDSRQCQSSLTSCLSKREFSQVTENLDTLSSILDTVKVSLFIDKEQQQILKYYLADLSILLKTVNATNSSTQNHLQDRRMSAVTCSSLSTLSLNVPHSPLLLSPLGFYTDTQLLAVVTIVKLSDLLQRTKCTMHRSQVSTMTVNPSSQLLPVSQNSNATFLGFLRSPSQSCCLF